jgi:hypothetical protein
MKSPKEMFDEMWAEHRDPFHKREIAEIITRIAREEPNLVNFAIFPNAFGAALGEFKMIVSATPALKKPFFTTWEKHLVLTTLKHPVIFETLASFIVLSASGKRDGVIWNGKGRMIDAKLEANMSGLRELTKEMFPTAQPPPDSYFIEIGTSPYFDRLNPFLESPD